MEFIGEEEEFVDRSKKRRQGGRPAINKKTKLSIVFDPEARKKFLTGFRKRKQERKERYQEKLQRELAEEKIRSREEAKKTVAKKQSSSHSILPEVEHLLESSSSDDEELLAPSTFSIGTTTVSISSLDSQLYPRQSMVKQESEDSSDSENGPLLRYPVPAPPSIVESTTSAPLTTEQKDALKIKKLKAVLKNPLLAAAKTKTETLVRKETHRLLQHSSIYKKTLQIKQRQSKKFKLNRFQPQEETGGGGNKTPTKKSSKKAAAAKVKVKSRGRVTK